MNKITDTSSTVPTTLNLRTGKYKSAETILHFVFLLFD